MHQTRYGSADRERTCRIFTSRRRSQANYGARRRKLRIAVPPLVEDGASESAYRPVIPLHRRIPTIVLQAQAGPFQTRSFFLSTGVIAVAGVTGLLVPFLGFFDPKSSPLNAMLQVPGTWRLALPAFLSVPICAAYLIWKIRGRFSRAAAGILYALSAATAFLIIWNLITFMEEGDRRVAFAVLCAMTCLVTGAVLLTRNLRIRNSHPLHSVMALQVCYVSHVVFCIISFVYPGLFGFPHLSLAGWGAGGYLSVATIALYAAQVWTATQSP